MADTDTPKHEKDEKEEKAEVFEERLVTPERVRVWEDDLKKLCITIDGKDFPDLHARKVFPLSGKAGYVSFLNKDGKETVMLARPRKLDGESRKVLEHALGRMYYAATIERVHSITEKMGVGHWQVETDRGHASFEVVDRQTIRRLPDGRIVMADADGNRFEIRDVEMLDDRSRKLVESEI